MGDIDRIARMSPTVQAPLAAQRSGDAPRRSPHDDPGHEDSVELTNVEGEDEELAHGPPPPPDEPGHLDLAV